VAASVKEFEPEDADLVSWLLKDTYELQFQWLRELEDLRSNQICGICTIISQLVLSDIPKNVSLRIQKSESKNSVVSFRSLSAVAVA
jgi:hypothetical protein